MAETPFAVIDFETTGLRAGPDRVIEVAVVRLDPGHRPVLVLDTLVNPQRTVGATEIHGITDEDVADAPPFRDVAADVARSIGGAVVAAYNVYFDYPFLQYELSSAGLEGNAPHLCVMYLRAMLEIGKRCSLDDACTHHGISRSTSHTAAADAMAAAQLMSICLASLTGRGVETFDDLRRRNEYKFTASFDQPLLSSHVSGSQSSRLKPRCGLNGLDGAYHGQRKSALNPVALYWDELVSVLSDLAITGQEIEALRRKKHALRLDDEQARALHARAFAHVINQFIDDRRLSDAECGKLNRLYTCLQELSWAPGQPV